nr:hypothetical protein asmbl_2 [uncultured bacterium]
MFRRGHEPQRSVTAGLPIVVGGWEHDGDRRAGRTLPCRCGGRLARLGIVVALQ